LKELVSKMAKDKKEKKDKKDKNGKPENKDGKAEKKNSDDEIKGGNAPPLRRGNGSALGTPSLGPLEKQLSSEKITYDINEGSQPHEIISQNIQKFFKYNEKNLVRPQVQVDSMEQAKARTWVFFLIVVQLIVCIGYGFFLNLMEEYIIWWLLSVGLITYYGTKLIFIFFFNVRRLFTCHCCSSEFDPETMATFEEVFVCIPVYNESKASLERVVTSIYSSHYTKHKMYMVFIVDGNKNNTFQSLLEVLEGTPFEEKVQNGKTMVKHGVCHGICYSVYLKEATRGKRDSQWVFIELVRNIFPEHKPPYLVFMDSDTEIHADALRYMVDRFRHDPMVAGVCGGIKISNLSLRGEAVDNILFRLSTMIIVGMQYYEYCWNALFSKQFEGCFSALTGTHGQFTMYRTDILVNIDAQALETKESRVSLKEIDAKLQEMTNSGDKQSVSFYYVSKVKKEATFVTQDFFSKPTIGLMDRNMYDLGSERTLATRLIQMKYKIVYEPRAMCQTEVPDSISKFLHRRRRWQNSTFMNQLVIFFTPRLWAQPRMWVILIMTMFDLIGLYVLPTHGVVLLDGIWRPMFAEIEVSTPLILFIWILVQIIIMSSTTLATSDMFYVLSTFTTGLIMAFAAYFFVHARVIYVVQFFVENLVNWQRMVVYLILPLMHIIVSLFFPLAFFAALAIYLMFPTIAITAPLYSFFHLDDFTWASR